MPNPIIRVSEWRLRKIFNDGQYWEKTKSGEFKAHVKRQTHPTRMKANEPYCTYTQEVTYLKNNLEVARVHQYERPDKTIGASGRPDPKRVLHNQRIYALRKPAKNTSERIRYFLIDCFERLVGRA
jgi:hypothetical protein